MTQYNQKEKAIEALVGGEFERERVPRSRLQSWKALVGMYAGEHPAGAEFVIGALF